MKQKTKKQKHSWHINPRDINSSFIVFFFFFRVVLKLKKKGKNE